MHRRTAILGVLAFALAGCATEIERTTAEGCRVIETHDRAAAESPRGLDVVIAVDSSPASAPLRSALAARAASIARSVVTRAEAGDLRRLTRDVRITVVGGDLGCDATPSEPPRARTRPSSGGPATCAAEYAPQQEWPAQGSEAIASAVECLAWATDTCDAQRPMLAALDAVSGIEGVRRDGSALLVYVVSAVDEAPGLEVEEIRPRVDRLGPFVVELGVVAGVPGDLDPLSSPTAITDGLRDPRFEGGTACAIEGASVPTTPRLLALAAEAGHAGFGSAFASSLCGPVPPAATRIASSGLSALCLSRIPAVDPLTSLTRCTVTETPLDDLSATPCADRIGRDPTPLAVDAEGRETCAILQVATEDEDGFFVGAPSETCGDQPAIRPTVALEPHVLLDIRCITRLDTMPGCE
ncbi:hypothetical protein [Sandaracinus amylolyticus]|uniref:hypothetical protein n=1 Tax=Sandaracinus amylolyticus TaxID=927083 RepID=UPI001F3CF760|nr:hypothetical protein [Sandaracinus amylolyticus]UJR86519.1 Hypothetical protein I5071_86140 [Sandaracinus amylolyticus]